MRKIKNDGFTIIELSLFVAISTLMLFIGFSAISGKTQDVQSTDSIRTLESQLRRNLSQVGTGLNLRGDINCELGGSGLDFSNGSGNPPIGQNQNCVANGVLLRFGDQGSLDVHTIASDDSLDEGQSSLESLENKLASGRTMPVPNTLQEVSFIWQLRYIGGYEGGDIDDRFDDIDFLRLRATNSSAEYMFIQRGGNIDTLSGFELIEDGDIYTLCFEGINTRRAAISIGSELQFQADLGDDTHQCGEIN